jgi:hypothetical protein
MVLNRQDEADRREAEKENEKAAAHIDANEPSVLFKYVLMGNQRFALVRKVGSTIEVRAPHAITIKPGQTRDVKLPARFRIVDDRLALRLMPANPDLALDGDYTEGGDTIKLTNTSKKKAVPLNRHDLIMRVAVKQRRTNPGRANPVEIDDWSTVVLEDTPVLKDKTDWKLNPRSTSLRRFGARIRSTCSPDRPMAR